MPTKKPAKTKASRAAGHVLVTGGAGYIGSVLTEELLARGYEVTVLDRLFFGNTLYDLEKRGKLHIVEGDVRSIEPTVFKGVDAIMDLAALSNDPAGDLDPQVTLDINFDGRARMAELAKENGVKRYILASSCSVYGFQVGMVDEESNVNPLTAYAKAARHAERVSLSMADDNYCVTALRQATVYGPTHGNKPDQGRMRFDLVVNVMTKDLLEKGYVTLNPPGTQMRPLVHIRDTARAFIEVMEADAKKVNGQIFNVGSTEQNYTLEVLARVICQALGLPANIQWGDIPDKRSYAVDFGKIYRVLGYETKFTVTDAAREIAEKLKRKTIDTGPKTHTMNWYRTLLREDPNVLAPLEVSATDD